jgi:hypothetical protein
MSQIADSTPIIPSYLSETQSDKKNYRSLISGGMLLLLKCPSRYKKEPEEIFAKATHLRSESRARP